MKRLPRPAPALSATTLPPCSSASRRTSVRPMPRPAWLRSSERSSWTKSSKMLPSCSAAMPMPSSLTLATSMSPSTSGRERDPSARRRELDGVDEQVAEHLREGASGSPSSQTGSAGRSTLKACSMRSASGRAASAASCSSAVASTRSGCRFSLPRRDPAGVEQVVDQAHEVGELALDHGASAGEGVAVGRRHLHDRDRVADRRQRIAQLVRQHRHELVLAPRRLAQLVGVVLAFGDVDRGRDQKAPAVGVAPAGPVKKCQVRDAPLATRSSRSPLSTRFSMPNSERIVASTIGCRSP